MAEKNNSGNSIFGFASMSSALPATSSSGGTAAEGGVGGGKKSEMGGGERRRYVAGQTIKFYDGAVPTSAVDSFTTRSTFSGTMADALSEEDLADSTKSSGTGNNNRDSVRSSGADSTPPPGTRVSSQRPSSMSSPGGQSIPSNTWSREDAATFSLRVGPNYKSTGRKAPSAPALYELVGVDTVQTDSRIDNIGAKVELPSEWTNVPGMTDPRMPSLFIVNFQMPSEFPTSLFTEIVDGKGYSVVLYFRVTEDTVNALSNLKAASPAVRLFHKYCTRAPEMDKDSNSPYRSRFKITVRCDNIDEFGLPSFITSYNAKPVLIRNTGTLLRGPGYVEMDINVHRFASVPKKALQILISRFNKMYVKMGFCIESREDSEMPETLFGCAALNKMSTVAPKWNMK